MAFVQKAVARLNEPEKLQTLVRDLGRKHVGYGAKRRYVDVSIEATTPPPGLNGSQSLSRFRLWPPSSGHKRATRNSVVNGLQTTEAMATGC